MMVSATAAAAVIDVGMGCGMCDKENVAADGVHMRQGSAHETFDRGLGMHMHNTCTDRDTHVLYG